MSDEKMKLINELPEIYKEFISELSAISNVKTEFPYQLSAHKQSKYLLKAMLLKQSEQTEIKDSKVKRYYDQIELIREDGKLYFQSDDPKVGSLLSKQSSVYEYYKLSKRVKESFKLTSLASLFESTLINLTINYMKVCDFQNNDYLKKSEISLEELDKYSSIQELKEYQIMKYLNGLTYKGIDKWLLTLSKMICPKLKNNTDFKNTIPDVSEFFQTRNLLVHNGGIVNNLYFKNVPVDIAERRNAIKDKRINIDETYFQVVLEKCVFIVNLFLISIVSQFMNAIESTKEKLDYLSDIQESCLKLYDNKLYRQGAFLFKSFRKMSIKEDKDSLTTFLLEYNYLLGGKLEDTLNETNEFSNEEKIDKLFFYAKKNTWWHNDEMNTLLLKIAEMSLTKSPDDFFEQVTKDINDLLITNKTFVYGGMLSQPVFMLVNQNGRWEKFVDSLYEDM
ncbi:hypothetical protein [Fructobacillus cardui]|uniref:hypothetical protein n=1 Tax=Fructobacillus cardui TaxID=2893170 RepID=UPI002D9C812E|nr:hypothetical protein R53653_IHELHDKM_00296 [Fructobacillus cardui]